MCCDKKNWPQQQENWDVERHICQCNYLKRDMIKRFHLQSKLETRSSPVWKQWLPFK